MKDLHLEDQFFDSVLYEVPETKEIKLPEGSEYAITVISDEDALSNDGNASLLSNIITALGFNYGKETNLIAVSKGQVIQFSSIKELESPRILVFGNLSSLMTTQMQHRHNTLAIVGNQEWVFSFELAEFADDKSKKMELWKAIQHWKKA